MVLQRVDERDRVLLILENDTEESPWMVGTDFQYQAIKGIEDSLRRFLVVRRPDWYLSAESFIDFPGGVGHRRGQLGPDIYAAPVGNRPRMRYVVEKEGGLFPPFVIEVVSEHSVERDTVEKVALYEVLGVREYLLFAPAPQQPPVLWGYQRDEQERFVEWPTRPDGSLFSGLLGAGFRVEGQRVRVLTPEGEPVPFAEELDAARKDAEQARAAAEQEIVRLRAELERLRNG